MNNTQQADWNHATWEGAEAARHAVDRKLSFRQKLEWNAQALAFAKRLKKKKK